MRDLKTLIDLLCRGRRIHISVTDFDGVLCGELTALPLENVIHLTRFCDAAKGTVRGMRLCLYCKSCANAKAKKFHSFTGLCPFGLCEAVVPVVIRDTVRAAVYVGHAVYDRESSRARMMRSAKYCGSDYAELDRLIDECETVASPDELLAIGEVVADYIVRLTELEPPKDGEHWLIGVMRSYADDLSRYGPVTLKSIAALCNKNEKYIGRLFLRVTGESFADYCNGVRLERAKKLLAHSRERVIDIAMECGFESVTYFNRLFMRKYGATPSEYRRAQAKSE